MNIKMNKENITLIKPLACKAFWYIFIAQALFIIYSISPKECTPIVTYSEDFIYLSGPNIIQEGEQSPVYKVNIREVSHQDINVSLAYSGTAEENLDYTPVKNIVIKKGELFTEFQLKTLDDPYAEYNEELAIKIVAVDGESFLNTFHISNPDNVIYTKILDEKNPKNEDNNSINITLEGDSTVYEDSKENIYKVNLSQIAVEDIDLNISYEGNAKFDIDYQAPKQVTIKKGTQFASFTIKPINDIYKENSEEVKVSISGLDDIGYEDIRYTESMFNIQIKDEIKPLKAFNIELHAQEKAKESEKIKYTLKTETVLQDDLSFIFYIDSDDSHTYNEEIHVTMKKGTNRSEFELLVKDDNLIEKSQSITLDSYTIENDVYELIELDPVNSRTEIHDNEKSSKDGAELTLSLLNNTAIYEDSKEFTVLVQSSQVVLKDLQCKLQYSGSAHEDKDFIAPQSVKIKKGQNKASFKIKLLNDNLIENEEIIIKLTPKTNGGLESIEDTDSLSVTLNDELEHSSSKLAATISLTGSKQVQEAKKPTYLIELSQKLEANLAVNFLFSEHGAKEGEDFIAQKTFIIEKGLKKKEISIELVDNKTAENIESFQIALDSFEGGGLESIVINQKKQAVMTSITDEIDIINEFKKIVEKQKILFEHAKDSIDSKSFTTLDSIVELLLQFPQVLITVEGHTDSSGSKYRNQELSQRRANSVKKYLINKGIPKARLKSIGYGESRPLVPDSDPNAATLNKRVGFKVKYKEKR